MKSITMAVILLAFSSLSFGQQGGIKKPKNVAPAFQKQEEPLQFQIKTISYYPDHRSATETATLRNGVLSYEYHYRGTDLDEYYMRNVDKTADVSTAMYNDLRQYIITNNLLRQAAIRNRSEKEIYPGSYWIARADSTQDAPYSFHHAKQIDRTLYRTESVKIPDIMNAEKCLRKKIQIQIRMDGNTYTHEMDLEKGITNDHLYAETVKFLHYLRNSLGVPMKPIPDELHD